MGQLDGDEGRGSVSWGVSNISGCFKYIGVFRIYWGHLYIYILECFKSIGGDLSTPLNFECVVIVCSECYGVFSLFRAVLHIWATVRLRMRSSRMLKNAALESSYTSSFMPKVL